MGIVEWAVSPLGQTVPIHIAWVLIWIALIAGVGLLAMRANGETGWWSGHLMFTLCPREDDAIVCHCRDQISLTFLCPQ